MEREAKRHSLTKVYSDPNREVSVIENSSLLNLSCKTLRLYPAGEEILRPGLQVSNS